MTPHATEPMPRDGRKPSETEILIVGRLQPRLHRACRAAPRPTSCSTGGPSAWSATACVDPERGFFVDQRWIDFAPGPGRRASTCCATRATTWPTGTSPARELEPARRALGGERPAAALLPLQRLQARPARPALHPPEPDPDQAGLARCAQICAEYADELMARGLRGREPLALRATTRCRTGMELDSRVRRGVPRRATARGELDRSRCSSPRARAALLDYLNGPADAGGALGRDALPARALRGGRRPAGAVPRPARRGRRRTWWRGRTPTRGAGIPQHAAAEPTPPGGGATGRPRAGVNLAGYFRSVLGRRRGGARARRTRWRRQNVAVAPVGLVAGHSGQEESDVGRARAGLRHLPDQPRLRERRRPARVRRPHGPGLLRGPPHDRLLVVGGRGVPRALPRGRSSTWTRCGPARATWPTRSPPSRRCRWCRSRRRSRCRRSSPLPREHFGLPEGFLYLFVFDYNSVFERKNPLAVIDAFSRAFEPGEGPALVLKCIGHERYPEQHARAAGAPPRSVPTSTCSTARCRARRRTR